MKNENINVYKTADLGLATILSLFFPIKELDRSIPPRVVFIFDRTPELDTLVERFWQKEMTVEPQTLMSQLRAIKTRLYET